MATATLELVNPYAKYGLKRRPTYNEIANLISENETLTGTLPNRDATFFKKTPQGSFFDGTDHLEILKEEQNRIMERQMREMMLRQNVRRNGGTFNFERLQTPSGTSTPAEVEPDRQTLSAQIQTDLREMERRRTERQQQTGEAHRGLLSRATTPIIEGLYSLSRASSRVFPTTNASTPSEVRRIFEQGELSPEMRQPETFVIGSPGESEAEGMTTARENNEELIKNSLRFQHPNATSGEITRATHVLLKYSYLNPEQVATRLDNFNILNEIYGSLVRNGFISDAVMEKYQSLTFKISDERGGRKRAKLLRELSEHYKKNVYDKYISNISERPVPA